MTWYHIGAFSFPASWVAIAASSFMTIVVLYLLKEKKIADLYSNALFLCFVVWKLSIVLFEFSISVSHPMSILYFNGGTKGFFLGIAVGMLYLLKKIRIDHEVDALGIAWVFQGASFELLVQALNGFDLIPMCVQLAGNALLVTFMIKAKKEKNHSFILQLQTLFLLFQGFIDSNKGALLTPSLFSYLLLYLLMLIFYWKRRSTE
ncbi:hypothetical protein [Falsibacillus albus]|uniref:Prolipoprotein diacylglyceryl transferase n=1 Tax=Falsibacillus albus TaxID=2478915 RepID=A0A3L7K413_9BACI|nr:hypothetical protein [Falsibacillus albus]RLQ96751.1 hypothetical protein D9X91_06520 [Falsibacillus albus]